LGKACGLKECKLPVNNPCHPRGRPLKSCCAFPTIAPVLGETVGEARRKKGWSIEQLSKRSSVPGRLIREIESQSPSYVPSEANTTLLAEALRIPVGLLLGQRERSFERV
jgi:ribosome-binding protein aMBF1 (putative translation factor)